MPSHFSHVQLFATLCTVACQASLFMGFSRQEYWSGLPYPFLGDLSNPRIKLKCLMFPALAGRFLTTCATWEACRGFRVGNKHLYFGYIASVAPLEWFFFMRTTLDQFFYIFLGNLSSLFLASGDIPLHLPCRHL